MRKANHRLLVLIGLMLALFSAAFMVNDTAVKSMTDAADRLPPYLGLPLGLLAIVSMLLAGYSYQIGTGMICFAIHRRFSRPPFAFTGALSFPVSANIFMLLQALPFFLVPSGQSIRPMGWAALILMFALAFLVLGLVKAVRSMLVDKKYLQGAMGILLSFSPYFVAAFSMKLVCAIKGVQLSP